MHTDSAPVHTDLAPVHSDLVAVHTDSAPVHTDFAPVSLITLFGQRRRSVAKRKAPSTREWFLEKASP
jgi:hypothetical protein